MIQTSIISDESNLQGGSIFADDQIDSMIEMTRKHYRDERIMQNNTC